ncbi:MAG TPA: DUF938 domain-containing protein [Dongiaceae bacterium]|nr:DUF938 domain-containing protein [Dongiaceae bacterium]
MTTDLRQYAPAAARNREPICTVLQQVLPESGLVLEVASGSGEHVVHFATAFPGLVFQPSDPDAAARDSIAAWVAAAGLGNIRAPLAIDAAAAVWPLTAADAVICINMVHISPWQSTIGLVQGAAGLLPKGAPFYLYGPYRRDGAHTAESNAAFDADLRRRNPAWGLRDMEEVTALAVAAGFAAPEMVAMPANNFSLIFRRR